MLILDEREWKIFVRENITTFDIAWMHAMYNNYSLNRLSPDLADAVENFQGGVFTVFGGQRNF